MNSCIEDLKYYKNCYTSGSMDNSLFLFYVSHIKRAFETGDRAAYQKLFHIYWHISFNREQIANLMSMKLKSADEYDWN
jgi:hypothetical protein